MALHLPWLAVQPHAAGPKQISVACSAAREKRLQARRAANFPDATFSTTDWGDSSPAAAPGLLLFWPDLLLQGPDGELPLGRAAGTVV